MSLFARGVKFISTIGAVWITLILGTAKPACPDMGSVYLGGVRLSEEAQTAIIMHNYSEEVLILGTSFIANKPTNIVRFIPFPSEPRVSVSEKDIYDELRNLLNKKKIFYQRFTKGGSDLAGVDIRMRAKVSSHNITVIKINDTESFGSWAVKFLNKESPDGNIDEQLLENIKKIADDYVRRGYVYFVFDIVNISNNSEPVKPLIFRFKTDNLYYPLKTSNSIGGGGEIQLVFIIPGSLGIRNAKRQPYGYSELMTTFGRFQIVYGEFLSSSVKIYPDELKDIYNDSRSFFQDINHIYLQIFRIHSQYNFKNDLILDIKHLPPHKLVYVPATFGSNRISEEYLEYMTSEEFWDYVEAYPELKKYLSNKIHYNSADELYNNVKSNIELKEFVIRHIEERM